MLVWSLNILHESARIVFFYFECCTWYDNLTPSPTEGKGDRRQSRRSRKAVVEEVVAIIEVKQFNCFRPNISHLIIGGIL